MKAFSIICVISILLLAGCGKSKKQQETAPTPSVAVDHPQLRTVVYTFEYPGYLQARGTGFGLLGILSIHSRTTGSRRANSFRD